MHPSIRPLLLLTASTLCAGASARSACDFFCHLVQANKASLVTLADGDLLPPDLTALIARAIVQVIDEQGRPGARRSSNYLDFEARLIEIAGPEASRLHTGRSRQDLHGTVRRMLLRAALLDTYDALLGARGALLDLAQRHAETVIPAYTHGVPAQPVSLGHYVLAFSAALARDAQRLQEAYRRLNLSPLGAAALGTSGFPVDRERLAVLLGFDGIVENSYDANLISSADFKLEFASVLALSAIPIGQFTQDIHAQYRDPVPWFMLDEAVTDVSSIMPQKRNPRPLDRLRSRATAVLGAAHTISLNAHNTNTGMNDYRQLRPSLELAADAVAMYSAYADVVARIRVDPARALEELNRGYSTMTEVADTLLRVADVPFRVAHHYASELTHYGRATGKRPAELSDEELRDIYRDAIGAELPLSVETVRAAMDPRAMVDNRRGRGGPQPAEVNRMHQSERESRTAGTRWLANQRDELKRADGALERAFFALLPESSAED